MSNLYQLDGRVPILQALPFGLQHVLAMFVSNITPIIILANAAGVDSSLSALLIQNCMIIAGIGTLVQLYPVWRIGSRLPIVMGISFTFLSLSITIASTQGMPALMGAVIVGGLMQGLLGLLAKYWLRIVTPVVSATVVTAIGFSLLPIGANSFAGGQGAPDFGSWQNWMVGTITLVVCLLTQVFAKGPFRSLSVLVGLVVGYVTALCMGMVDFSGMSDVKVISLPTILPFKPEFHLGTILSVFCIFLVAATENIGDCGALCSGALHREPTKREVSGAIACDGIVSTLAGAFGCTPITTFMQNVGLVNMSKVINRFTIGVGACIMIIGGLFPAIGALLATVPQSVLGGCTIIMFGSIIFAGFEMMSKCGFGQRNLIIVSLSLSVGLGFTAVPQIFALFPDIVRSIFAENCVAVAFVLAVFLNLILPKNQD
ncbi:MAG: purine permease [Bacteroidales bacterium]|nr:purine permease [Bacteroidales bacterium]